MSKITNPTTEPSVTCGFFNSRVTANADGTKTSDRLYDAKQMSAIFDGLIYDGVFASIGDCLVVKASSGSTVNVGTGKCWFDHTWTLNDAPLPVDCGEPPTNLKRIDAVVVEVNLVERDNYIKVVTGDAASDPAKPEMTKNTEKVQHALCYITRKPGLDIGQADIENVIGTDETPFVTGIVQVTSLDTLLGQWQQELDDFTAAEKADLDAWYLETKQLMSDIMVEMNAWTAAEKTTIMNWFDDVKGKLSEDPALNLQIQIDANEVERLLVDGLPDGKKTISGDGKEIRTVDSKGRELVKTFSSDFLTITSVLKDQETKEYLPYPYSTFGGASTKTVNGITFTDNGDRTVTVNGTATADAILVVASSLALAKDIYVLSGCPVGGSEETYYLGVNLFNNTTYVTAINDEGYGASLDTTGIIYTTCNVLICIKSGVTVTNLVFEPKVTTTGSELGRLVKKLSKDGLTIETTLTNNSDAVPNLVEIERAVDAIITNENSYIGGDGT